MQGLTTVAPTLPVPWVLPFSSSVTTFSWNFIRSPIVLFIIPQGIFLHRCHILRIKSSCCEDRVITISFSLQNGIPGFLANLEDACLRRQRRTWEIWELFVYEWCSWKCHNYWCSAYLSFFHLRSLHTLQNLVPKCASLMPSFLSHPPHSGTHRLVSL